MRASSTSRRTCALDAAWHALVERLNRVGAPVELKAVRAIARDGYGWTEFIDHAGCADDDGCQRFFRRAGAWLALFHCFAGTDMHQENMIAAGEHPVPIDLEMILQASAPDQAEEIEAQAFRPPRRSSTTRSCRSDWCPPTAARPTTRSSRWAE